MYKIRVMLYSSMSSCMTIVLLLYFFASHNNTKATRGLKISNVEIEIAPKLPDNYVEPYVVKYDFKLDRRNSSKMPSAMANAEHATLMETLRQMCRLFGANDIKWMMTDGSMIGSLRHWDIVPWDDDFDVLVNVEDHGKLTKLLNSSLLKEDYGLDWKENADQKAFIHQVIKLYSWNSTTIKKTEAENFQHKWPFVDVFFYSQNETHLWYKNVKNIWYKNGKNFVPLESVFPLQLRPMGKYWFPMANNPHVYVETYYPEGISDKCVRSEWNHRVEAKQRIYKKGCSELKDDYFFVRRECIERYCLEKLMLRGIVYKQILFPFN